MQLSLHLATLLWYNIAMNMRHLYDVQQEGIVVQYLCWNHLLINICFFFEFLPQNKWCKPFNSNPKQDYLKIIMEWFNQNLIEVILTIRQLWQEKFAVCRKLSKDYQILSENFTFQSHTCRNVSYCDSPVVHISSKVKMKSVSELLYLQTVFCRNFHTHLGDPPI